MYTTTFELDGKLDPTFTKAFNQAVDKTDKLSNDIKRASKEANSSQSAFGKAAGAVRQFGDVLGRVAQYTGAFAIVDGVASSFSNVIGTIGDFQGAMKHIQASTGASKAEMMELEASANRLYKQPLGENIDDLSRALVTSRNITHQQGAELEKTAKNAVILRDVFEYDYNESLRTTDTLMKNFGITSEQSMNLLAQGTQKGLDKSGELLDSANEYAPHFKTLGFSANQMFDTFSAGLEKGAFNLDKVGDAVKEFNIRSKDGSKSSEEAYKALGLNAAKMSQTFAKGGPAAQAAFKKIVQAISSVKDPVKKNAIGVGLFGTQFEDLEKDVIAAMGTARSQFDMTLDTMKEIEKVQYETPANQLKMLGRTLMTDLVMPITKDLMPMLQSLTKWATENKDTVKMIALAVPAALIGKNVLAITSSIGGISGVASKATKGVGMLGSAVGLLSNPFGIAVAAAGGLSLGFLALKRHQEKARQSVIQMGTQLQAASSKYDEMAKKAGTTNDLIWEFDQLSQKVSKNAGNTKNLAYEQGRLAEITKQLQGMFPEVISQHDVESGKLRDKAGLLKQELDAKQKLARLELEAQVAEGQQKLPKLEGEIQSLQQKTAELQKQNDAIDKAKSAFTQYQAEFGTIMKQGASDQRTAQLEALRQKVNEVGESVGYIFNNNAQLSTLGNAVEDLASKRASQLQEQLTKAKELETAQATYEQLYQSQTKLIELDYGGNLAQQAEKYKTLSAAEQERFNKALADVAKLHGEMDLLPTDKRINVDVVYRELGNKAFQIPTAPVPMGPVAKPNGYAKGGVVSRPELAWVGEGGDQEVIIPINNSKRSQGLYERAGRMLGQSPASAAGGSQNSAVFNFSPVYNFNGNADKAAVQQMETRTRSDFGSQFNEFKRQQQRVSLT